MAAMPSTPSPSAIVRTIPTSAPLDATYATWCPPGRPPEGVGDDEDQSTEPALAHSGYERLGQQERRLDVAYRLDLVVCDCVVVEIKCVANLLPIHDAQILSYLKLSGYKVGLLINFHVTQLKDGIKRFVNRL